MKKLSIALGILGICLTAYGKPFYVGTSAEFKPYEYLENGEIARI